MLLPHTFERHAGCKTKQPNNYIYFENGKSTNQVVQELKSTPENQLFDAIHTVTGSPINEKAFNIWKGGNLFGLRDILFHLLFSLRELLYAGRLVVLRHSFLSLSILQNLIKQLLVSFNVYMGRMS